MEKSNKPSLRPEEECQVDLGREGLDEEERKSIQRKEAEEIVKFAKALGIKASVPDDEAAQFFINMDEDRKREREREERRNREY
ncbi:hypothetical protein QQ045_003113 [Rhodiola kirilowii]